MDASIKKWNMIAREYDTLITRGDFFRNELLDPTLVSLLPSLKGKRVLDAGCGQGYFSHILRAKGASVVGVDGSEELIALARAHYPESDTLHFAIHDLTKPLTFFNTSFDGVIANMVLMDFDPIEPALREFARVTRPGGFLILSILHPFFVAGRATKNVLKPFTPPHYELSRYATPFKTPWRIPGMPHETVVYHRPLEQYTRLLADAGFVIADIHEPTLSPHAAKERSNAEKLLTEIPVFLIMKAEKRAHG